MTTISTTNVSVENFNNIVSYLNSKGVPFLVKLNYKNNEPVSETIVGITITKTGKFYKANGKIIAGNFAKLFI